MHRHRFTIFTTVLFLCGLCLSVDARIITAGSANHTTGFAVSPINYDLSLRPGVQQQLSVTVRNQLETAASFQIHPGLFGPDGVLVSQTGETGTSENTTAETANDNSPINWLSYAQQSVTLEPGTSAEITYSLDIPAPATPGVYYLATIVSLENPAGSADEVTGASSAVIAQVAQRLNVNVLASDAARPSLSIAELSGPRVLIGLGNNGADYQWQVQNISTLFTKPIIYTQVVSPTGDILTQEVVNSGLNLIGPGESTAAVLGANAEIFTSPGVYRFEILVVDSVDGGAPASSKAISTLYIPWWLALLIILAATPLVYVALKIRRR